MVVAVLCYYAAQHHTHRVQGLSLLLPVLLGLCLSGATENARHENTGRSKMQGWKMRDMKMRHQFARVENAGKVTMESQSVKKCLKVVVFVCRVIPSV